MVKNKLAIIDVQPNTMTFEDAKTGVRSVGYAFQFPSGKNGFIVLTRLDKRPWNVIEDISKITIEFK